MRSAIKIHFTDFFDDHSTEPVKPSENNGEPSLLLLVCLKPLRTLLSCSTSRTVSCIRYVE